MNTNSPLNTGKSHVVLAIASLIISLAAWGVVHAADVAEPIPHSDSIGAVIGDTTITAVVKAKYLGDERLKGSEVSVTTTNGVVTLKGTAPSSDVKAAAEEIARSADGVKSVDNQIEAPSLAGKAGAKAMHAARATHQAVSDSWITAKVKSRLLADSLAGGFEISVKTVHGVVALTGNVDTRNAADRAAALAREITGVKSVDASGIIVKSG